MERDVEGVLTTTVCILNLSSLTGKAGSLL